MNCSVRDAIIGAWGCCGGIGGADILVCFESASVGHSCPTERTRMVRWDKNVPHSPFEADRNVCSTKSPAHTATIDRYTPILSFGEKCRCAPAFFDQNTTRLRSPQADRTSRSTATHGRAARAT